MSKADFWETVFWHEAKRFLLIYFILLVTAPLVSRWSFQEDIGFLQSVMWMYVGGAFLFISVGAGEALKMVIGIKNKDACTRDSLALSQEFLARIIFPIAYGFLIAYVANV